jgi:hypothetical protein
VGSEAAAASAYLYAAAAEASVGNTRLAMTHYDAVIAYAEPSLNRSAAALAVAWRAVRAPAEDRDRAYFAAIAHLDEARDGLGLWICLESAAAHLAETDPRVAALVLGHLEARGIGHVGLRTRRGRAVAAVVEAGEAPSMARGAGLDRAALVEAVLAALAGRSPAGMGAARTPDGC